jgi:hypothetical protein
MEARAMTTKASSTAGRPPGFSGVAHARSTTNRSRDDRASPKLTVGEREPTKPSEGGSGPGDMEELQLGRPVQECGGGGVEKDLGPVEKTIDGERGIGNLIY